jgi:mitogen-activated protein kinase organizer 1
MATPFPSTPLVSLPSTPYPIHALAYSASPAAYILTGSGDRAIRLYNPFPSTSGPRGAVQAGKLVQTFDAHGYEVLDLCVAR